jgi:hypothetical protein
MCSSAAVPVFHGPEGAAARLWMANAAARFFGAGGKRRRALVDTMAQLSSLRAFSLRMDSPARSIL